MGGPVFSLSENKPLFCGEPLRQDSESSCGVLPILSESVRELRSVEKQSLYSHYLREQHRMGGTSQSKAHLIVVVRMKRLPSDGQLTIFHKLESH